MEQIEPSLFHRVRAGNGRGGLSGVGYGRTARRDKGEPMHGPAELHRDETRAVAPAPVKLSFTPERAKSGKPTSGRLPRRLSDVSQDLNLQGRAWSASSIRHTRCSFLQRCRTPVRRHVATPHRRCAGFWPVKSGVPLPAPRDPHGTNGRFNAAADLSPLPRYRQLRPRRSVPALPPLARRYRRTPVANHA